jgi:DNA modification methylase
MYRNRIVEQRMMSPLELKANPKNWRKHPDVQRNGLDAALTEVGWVQSVILNQTTGHLIDGHLRIELAIKKGETQVPVNIVDLSPEEEDIILTSLDPISAMAQTNHEALTALISGITTTNPAMRDLIDRIQKKNKIVAQEQPEPGVLAAPSRVKAGDVWKLGQHLLVCGDCTVYANWERLLGDKRADICFTSPPYNVGKTAGQKEARYLKDADNKDAGSYLGLLQGFTTIALDHADELFVNLGLVQENKKSVIQYLAGNADAFKDIIYWVKSSGAPHIQEGIINNRVEPIYCFGDGQRKFKHANFPQGSYWNVIEGPGGQGNEYSDVHKATFPVYLPQNILSNFTGSGGSVIDPFMGTGTTLIAAEVESRICYGMELDPVYCDITLSRYQRLTGKEPEKQ